MITFLTSSFIKYQRAEDYVASPIDASHGFVDNLRMNWMENSRLLIFASNPDDYTGNDHTARELSDAFRLSGFTLGSVTVFDRRIINTYCLMHRVSPTTSAIESLREQVTYSDVIFLAGGHAPTENAFMKYCDLKGALGVDDAGDASYQGILITLSAGSVNAAESVYLIPEKAGETTRVDYNRITTGLGITIINMVPHARYIADMILDGRAVIDDIVAEASYGRRFYIIEDGSYFIIRNGITEFFGNGQVMLDGKTTRLRTGIINCDNAGLRRKDMISDLKNSNLLEALMNGAYDLIIEFNPDNGRLEFYHISEYFLEKGVIPANLDTFADLNAVFTSKMVVDEEKQASVEQLGIMTVLEEVASNGSYVRTVHIDTPDGVQAETLRIRRVENGSNMLLYTLSNISYVVDHDWMTDAFSRTGFNAKAAEVIRDLDLEEGYALVYTNIPGFKAINDMFGIHSGDMVIFQQRDVLKSLLNPVIMGRLEGDHFIMLVKRSHLHPDILEVLGDQTYVEGYNQYKFKIQCGIYPIISKDNDVRHMIDRAKLAENSIDAESGCNYVYYDENMRSEYLNRRMLISELDEALAAGEFKTYYQPVVDTRTHEIVSAEALVRWHHHDKGLISPGIFVPAFEQGGLITKIDNFMVNNVVRFNSERQEKGLKYVPCAVNLSRMDFFDYRLMSTVLNKFHACENIQDIIKVEVTESAYAVLESNAIDTLDEMHELGISVLLDDFGSGMSSMSTLESFGFDIIKLDMGFVRKIGRSKKTEAIIRSIIAMSHSLGAKVVAEGVETKEHLDFLEAAGCDMIQGYYFYKPMTEEEFAKLLG